MHLCHLTETRRDVTDEKIKGVPHDSAIVFVCFVTRDTPATGPGRATREHMRQHCAQPPKECDLKRGHECLQAELKRQSSAGRLSWRTAACGRMKLYWFERGLSVKASVVAAVGGIHTPGCRPAFCGEMPAPVNPA